MGYNANKRAVTRFILRLLQYLYADINLYISM